MRYVLLVVCTVLVFFSGVYAQHTGDTLTWDDMTSSWSTVSWTDTSLSWSWEDTWTQDVSQLSSAQSLEQQLKAQKESITQLIVQEKPWLLAIQTDAQNAWSSGSYQMIMCLQTGQDEALDRSLPFAKVQQAVNDDYIALSNKINTYKLNQELWSTGTIDYETLQLQIMNFGQNYQDTLMQLIEEAKTRFASNATQMSDFLTTYQSQVNELIDNKQRIERVITYYDEFIHQIRASRLFQWLTYQELAQTKNLMGKRFKDSMRSVLTKYIDKVAKEHQNIQWFSGQLIPILEAGIYKFDVHFDQWFDEQFTKHIDETTLSSINGTISSVQSMYYDTEGNITCSTLNNLSTEEKKLLTKVYDDLVQLSSWMKYTGELSPSQQQELKQQYLSKLQNFYKTSVYTILDDLTAQTDALTKLYDTILHNEISKLSSLLGLNKQYRSTYNTQEQATLRSQMCPTARELYHHAVSMRVVDKTKAILQNVCGIRFDEKTTSSPSSNQPKPSTATPEETPEETPQGDSSTTSPTNQTTIQQEVQAYIDDLEKKYPDEAVRAKAIDHILKNIDAALAEWTLDEVTIQMYTLLKAELEKRQQ